MLNDHLSILDQNDDAVVNKSMNLDNDGAEGDDGESGYVPKKKEAKIPNSHVKEKLSSAKDIRIKIWKQSVEPNSSLKTWAGSKRIAINQIKFNTGEENKS